MSTNGNRFEHEARVHLERVFRVDEGPSFRVRRRAIVRVARTESSFYTDSLSILMSQKSLTSSAVSLSPLARTGDARRAGARAWVRLQQSERKKLDTRELELCSVVSAPSQTGVG